MLTFPLFSFSWPPKVFVANPKKPPEVTKILVTNKAKLIAYLENFHNDRVRWMISCFSVGRAQAESSVRKYRGVF